MNIFSVSDILNFAIRVEQDGELFYQKAAMMVDDEGVRQLFNRLADEEMRHQRIFREMLDEVGDTRPPESYSQEYMTYLRDFIDGKVVFTKDLKGLAADLHDTLSALNFAIGRELESITYYQETKQFVAEKYHHLIDAVIAEERNHFAGLSEVKKNYLSRIGN
jgi:rubrerythrin